MHHRWWAHRDFSRGRFLDTEEPAPKASGQDGATGHVPLPLSPCSEAFPAHFTGCQDLGFSYKQEKPQRFLSGI